MRWTGRGGEWPLWASGACVWAFYEVLAVTAFLLENVHLPSGPGWGLGHLQRASADHLQVLQKGRWGHTVGPSRLLQPLLPWSQVSHIQLEVSMAEQEPTAEQLAQIAAENEEDEHSVNYKPPAQKSIQEIQELDKDDESLRKYKEALLGRVAVSAGKWAPVGCVDTCRFSGCPPLFPLLAEL